MGEIDGGMREQRDRRDQERLTRIPEKHRAGGTEEQEGERHFEGGGGGAGMRNAEADGGGGDGGEEDRRRVRGAQLPDPALRGIDVEAPKPAEEHGGGRGGEDARDEQSTGSVGHRFQYTCPA